MSRVIVVGAGVIGLSCAVRLAESGYDTHVLARDLPLETTSAVAGGLWLPYLAQPADKVRRWGAATLAELTALAASAPESGVRMTPGLLLHREPDPPRPGWADHDGLGLALELVADPRPGYRSGWSLTVPLVETTAYLPWLSERLAAAGGTITRMPLSALPQRGVVVNATGVSARAMAGDSEVAPVRGQVVVRGEPGPGHLVGGRGRDRTVPSTPSPVAITSSWGAPPNEVDTTRPRNPLWPSGSWPVPAAGGATTSDGAGAGPPRRAASGPTHGEARERGRSRAHRRALLRARWRRHHPVVGLRGRGAVAGRPARGAGARRGLTLTRVRPAGRPPPPHGAPRREPAQPLGR